MGVDRDGDIFACRVLSGFVDDENRRIPLTGDYDLAAQTDLGLGVQRHHIKDLFVVCAGGDASKREPLADRLKRASARADDSDKR